MWIRKTQTLRTTREVVTASARRGEPSILIPREYLRRGSTCPGGSPEDFPGEYFMRVDKFRTVKMTSRLGEVFLTRAGFEHFKEDLKTAWAASGNLDWGRFERSVNIFFGGVDNETARQNRRKLRHTFLTLSRDQVVAAASRGLVGGAGLEARTTYDEQTAREPEDFPKTHFIQLQRWGHLPASARSGITYLSRAGFEHFKEDLRAAYEAAPPPPPTSTYNYYGSYGYGYSSPAPQGPRRFEDFEKAAVEFYKNIESAVTHFRAGLQRKRDRLDRDIQKLDSFTF